MGTNPTRQHFVDAVDALIAQIKQDKSVIAAILCGSLSHDTVWAKSDVDLVLVTIDDRAIDGRGLALYADGVNVHAILYPRADFRKLAEGAVRNSFMHSFLAKGRLLYTHDESVAQLFARLSDLGERDTKLQLFRAATNVLPALYKAHKWMITRGDLDYTALWILYAAEPLAQIEVIGARLLADREVLPQALKLNPEFFAVVYTGMLNAKKTRKSVQAALDAVDGYLGARATELYAPVIEHLRDVGDTRSCTEIEDYCQRHYGVEHATTACEYLADQGLIGKAASSIRLTKRSNVDVQELAFFAIDG
jgi:uncharacterized protein